ncbi:MAG: DUF2795 domain-containing protein [Armatimonadetes bacterium]|jgi:hypothetical protein|nr:DUF2795 domain-containing protein [Armatimonadota bacterium]
MGICDFISSNEGAKKCLADIEFPATKQQVLYWVESSDGPEAVVVAANKLPDKIYDNMNDLLESLGTAEQAD